MDYYEIIVAPFEAVLDPTDRIYWLYLLLALLFAALLYISREAKGHSSLAGMIGHIFPRSVWLNRSTLNDFIVHYITAVVQLVLFGSVFTSLT